MWLVNVYYWTIIIKKIFLKTISKYLVYICIDSHYVVDEWFHQRSMLLISQNNTAELHF